METIKLIIRFLIYSILGILCMAIMAFIGVFYYIYFRREVSKIDKENRDLEAQTDWEFKQILLLEVVNKSPVDEKTYRNLVLQVHKMRLEPGFDQKKYNELHRQFQHRYMPEIVKAVEKKTKV
jgi:hypothetical protein